METLKAVLNGIIDSNVNERWHSISSEPYRTLFIIYILVKRSFVFLRRES